MNDSFRPPTAEQVETWLDRHPPRPPSMLAMWAPLLMLAGMLAAVLLMDGLWGALLPWVGLGAVLGYLVLRVRRAKLIEQRVAEAQDLAMLRHHKRALAMGWRLLPTASTAPGPYLRTTTLIGHCLEELDAHESAIVCFDRLIGMLPEDHPGTLQLCVHRAIAALGAERLLDADDALRRLRGSMGQYARTPLGAMYRLARLLQIVRTGHYDDAIADADTLLDALRPLGVDAGYGHALLALCYHQSRGHGDEAGDEHAAHEARGRRREHAATWWRRATTLLPADALIQRFPELKAIGDLP